MADQPRPGGALVGLGERAAGEEDRGDRQLLGGQGPQVIGQEGGLLGRSSRRREALGELAPATHGSMVYRAGDGAESVVPGGDRGSNGSSCAGTSRATWRPSSAGTRTPRSPGWRATRRRRCDPRRSSASSPPGSSDPTRWRWPSTSGRRTGSSGRARSASSTARTARRSTTSRSARPDAWGHGYGTEATQLMVDHAFGTLGLHRIALYVFEFNERAIRAYRRCGFVIEGRVARIDLARRPLVGRAGDERPRVRLAARGRATTARRCRGVGRATARRRRERVDRAGRGRAVGSAATNVRAVPMTTEGPRRGGARPTSAS